MGEVEWMSERVWVGMGMSEDGNDKTTMTEDKVAKKNIVNVSGKKKK